MWRLPQLLGCQIATDSGQLRLHLARYVPVKRFSDVCIRVSCCITPVFVRACKACRKVVRDLWQIGERPFHLSNYVFIYHWIRAVRAVPCFDIGDKRGRVCASYKTFNFLDSVLPFVQQIFPGHL